MDDEAGSSPAPPGSPTAAPPPPTPTQPDGQHPGLVLAEQGQDQDQDQSAPRVLVSKVLTYSDISTDVARTGRVVLPRLQVQSNLGLLLELGGAGHALSALEPGAPLRVAIELLVHDPSGTQWPIMLKTWQNIVSGEHRPTFVLENTAALLKSQGLHQGSLLALCAEGGRLVVRAAPRAAQATGGKAGGGEGAGKKGLATEGAVRLGGATCLRTPGCTKSAGHKGFCMGHQGFTKRSSPPGAPGAPLDSPKTPTLASRLRAVPSSPCKRRQSSLPRQGRRQLLQGALFQAAAAPGDGRGSTASRARGRPGSFAFRRLQLGFKEAEAASNLLMLLEGSFPGPPPASDPNTLPCLFGEGTAAPSMACMPGAEHEGFLLEPQPEAAAGPLAQQPQLARSSDSRSASPWDSAGEQEEKQQLLVQGKQVHGTKQQQQQLQHLQRGWRQQQQGKVVQAQAQAQAQGQGQGREQRWRPVRPLARAGSVMVDSQGSLHCVWGDSSFTKPNLAPQGEDSGQLQQLLLGSRAVGFSPMAVDTPSHEPSSPNPPSELLQPAGSPVCSAGFSFGVVGPQQQPGQQQPGSPVLFRPLRSQLPAPFSPTGAGQLAATPRGQLALAAILSLPTALSLEPAPSLEPWAHTAEFTGSYGAGGLSTMLAAGAIGSGSGVEIPMHYALSGLPAAEGEALLGSAASWGALQPTGIDAGAGAGVDPWPATPLSAASPFARGGGNGWQRFGAGAAPLLPTGAAGRRQPEGREVAVVRPCTGGVVEPEGGFESGSPVIVLRNPQPTIIWDPSPPPGRDPPPPRILSFPRDSSQEILGAFSYGSGTSAPPTGLLANLRLDGPRGCTAPGGFRPVGTSPSGWQAWRYGNPQPESELRGEARQSSQSQQQQQRLLPVETAQAGWGPPAAAVLAPRLQLPPVAPLVQQRRAAASAGELWALGELAPGGRAAGEKGDAWLAWWLKGCH